MTRLLLAVLFFCLPLRADELTVNDVVNAKGNKAESVWQFWFELAHQRGQFQLLDTHSSSVPRDGVPRKVRGPIASMLPNPNDTQGWIFHRDWDGRFEGIWGDRKSGHVLAYPYVEKNAHCAVAITYRVPEDGKYDLSGGLTDLQVDDKANQHDGIEWIVELAEGGKGIKKLGSGGPFGDGGGRPASGTFSLSGIEAKKGQLVRLVIHPRKWWGTDLTRIDSFKIVPAK